MSWKGYLFLAIIIAVVFLASAFDKREAASTVDQELEVGEYLDRVTSAPGSTLEERMEYLRERGVTLRADSLAELQQSRALFGSQKDSDTRDVYPSRALTGDRIVCTFERTLNVVYEGNEIIHQAPHNESSPGVDIFTGLDSDQPKLTYQGSVGTQGEQALQTVARSDDKIVLLDLDSEQTTVTLYTIFPKIGIGIWTKHTNLWGSTEPHATLSMGKCQ